MDRAEIVALAEGLVPFVREVTDEKLTPLAVRLAELEARPIEKGDPGPQGEGGLPGPPGPIGEVGPAGPKGGIDLDAMLPIELAAEVARAVRTLHEAPLLIERSEPSPPPKVIRIERDTEGNLVPIYDEPQP